MIAKIAKDRGIERLWGLEGCGDWKILGIERSWGLKDRGV
jgi:hypothetical protein